MNEKLYLGAASEKLTPNVGCRLYGYRPDCFSESVNDDLEATAFCFRQGETTALMISVTVCLINTALSDRILGMIEERFGIPRGSCLLHATHTHSGPNVAGTVGWGEIDAEYSENIFIPAILRAVEKAWRAQTEVTVGVVSGESLVGINRRETDVNNRVILGQNPWGAFDPKMTVISFKDVKGNTVANIVHYGAHGTAAGMNREISRDWPGVMTDKLTELTGGVTAFFNGPEGDVGPRLTNGLTVGERHVRYALELGAVAAQDAMHIYRRMAGYREMKLSVSCRPINIPLRPRPTIAELEEKYGKYKNETVNLDAAKGNYYRKIMRSYEEGYTDQTARPIMQTVIRLGEIAFISFPFELFSEIGMRIARSGDIPYALSLSNTNGSEGYFVTEDQLCRGGYEIDMFKTSYIQQYADNADWYAVTETLEHLREMKGE